MIFFSLHFNSDYTTQKNNSKAKEIADYYECLKEAKNKYMFKYILILEDDAEPSTLTTIEQITYSIILNVMEQKPDVIFAKLYYSLGYQGFSKNLETFVEITSFGLIIFCLVYGVLYMISKIQDYRQSHYIDVPQVASHEK